MVLMHTVRSSQLYTGQRCMTKDVCVQQMYMTPAHRTIVHDIQIFSSTGLCLQAAKKCEIADERLQD